jgi:uncharacterized protein (DUF4415 family)
LNLIVSTIKWGIMADAPEWSAENFARARSQRGPQKTPAKERVALRLDREIVLRFRAGDPDRRRRISEALADLVKRSSR